jgi:predicted RNase H-like nuclease (RuvC/YqgF family)
MEGETNGGQAQEQDTQNQHSEQAPAVQPKGEQQEQLEEKRPLGESDYTAQLKAKDKDKEIEALQAKIAEAAKTAEATETLNKEIAELKQRMADEHTEFALKSAGARSVTAAKALLAEHDGDVEALKAAEPWLFEQADAASQNGLQTGGMTGLEPQGASGGSSDSDLKRWERIAGVAEDSEE